MATNVSHESTSDGQARELIVGKLTRKLGVQTVASRGGQCPAISGLPGSRAGSEKREGGVDKCQRTKLGNGAAFARRVNEGMT
jgi:hypothetical protein